MKKHAQSIRARSQSPVPLPCVFYSVFHRTGHIPRKPWTVTTQYTPHSTPRTPADPQTGMTSSRALPAISAIGGPAFQSDQATRDGVGTERVVKP